MVMVMAMQGYKGTKGCNHRAAWACMCCVRVLYNANTHCLWWYSCVDTCCYEGPSATACQVCLAWLDEAHV